MRATLRERLGGCPDHSEYFSMLLSIRRTIDWRNRRLHPRGRGRALDATRFDELTRSLVRPGSRRRLLTSLAAGVLGLVGLGDAAARTCAAYGTICREHADCCSHLCGGRGRLKCQCRSIADCPTTGDQCLRTTCDNGTCTVVPRTNEQCDDGNPCTVNTHCTDRGRCVGDPKPCSDQSDACNVGTCDPVTGHCIKKPVTDGTGCNADSETCTVNDFCEGGVCKPGPRRECPPCQHCTGGECRATANDGRCGSECCNGDCCEAGEYCHTDLICTACNGINVTCDHTIECCSGRCIGGMCAQSVIGERCTRDFDCITNTCTNGVCACISCHGCGCLTDDNCCSGICLHSDVPELNGCFHSVGIGGACQHDSDCGTNTCTLGVCACVGSGLGCLGRDSLCCSGTCTGDQVCA